MQYPFWIYADEGEVIEPTAEELAAAAANPERGWYGCVLARNALLVGQVLTTLSGVATPEECCRECKQWEAADGSLYCNAWNHCNRPGGCR